MRAEPGGAGSRGGQVGLPDAASTDELIHHLAACCGPVRLLSAPWRRAALWLVFASVFLGAVVAVEGVRHDLARQMAQPYQIWQLGFAASTSVLAAFAASKLALVDSNPRWALLPMPTVIGWFATMGWGCLAGTVQALHGGAAASAANAGMAMGSGMEMEGGLSCVAFTLAVGGALLAALLFLLRHAGPVCPTRVTLLAALASSGLCFLGLTFVHHLDEAPLVLFWHGLAGMLLLGVGALAGRPALRRF